MDEHLGAALSQQGTEAQFERLGLLGVTYP